MKSIHSFFIIIGIPSLRFLNIPHIFDLKQFLIVLYLGREDIWGERRHLGEEKKREMRGEERQEPKPETTDRKSTQVSHLGDRNPAT